MKLTDLFDGEYRSVADTLEASVGAIDIAGLTADSRRVEKGWLFVALPGTKADGSQFIADAIGAGAGVVVTGGPSLKGTAAPVIHVENPRRFIALAAARLYARQPEIMVAVTGTAGKTSVASFVRQIWTHAGYAAAMIGTTGVIAPNHTEYGSLTTPDPVSLHQLLDQLESEGVTHAAMEASSHGLDQSRLDGVRLAAGAFTNLGRDHMDYHPTVEDYFQAKMRLFEKLLPKGSPAVIFADDEWSGRAIAAAKAAGHNVLTVGRNGEFLTMKRNEHFRFKQVAEIHHAGVIHEVHLPLAGDFQMANALVAAGLAISTGTDAAAVFAALDYIKGASGRLELVGHTSQGAQCYVDYAHKPDALEKVLLAVRPFTTGKVIVVFGCGGDRDRGKRPIMGEIATRLADVVIVTDDNPRSEASDAIRAEIMAATPSGIEVADRAQAIKSAVAMLAKGDTLIVAGKGHEEGQTIGNRTLPFSDHAELRKALGA